MTTYVCSGCGIENRASNRLTGLKHTTTGGKPSGCDGRYQPAARPAQLSTGREGGRRIEREDQDQDHGQPLTLAI